MSRGIEAKLQDKLVVFLKKNNVQYYKSFGGNYWLPIYKNGKRDFMCIKSPSGWPDIFVFFDKRMFFIELKTDVSKLNEEQVKRFTVLKEKGYEIFILRPRHWEKCKEKNKINFKKLLEEMERF